MLFLFIYWNLIKKILFYVENIKFTFQLIIIFKCWCRVSLIYIYIIVIVTLSWTETNKELLRINRVCE